MLDSELLYLVEDIAHPLGYHEDNHNGKTKTDVSGCFDQDDGQRNGHAHDTAQLGCGAHKGELAWAHPVL